ncbi:HNH endonuclease [Methanofollis fontis]|uniref:HNH endonuclease n=1 Tax=Methanofollis fontis TaxID=2052832 RepID=A0A483CXN0_9EURY|nr:HNH endonuclease [Methanofollis fontis]TAJ44083.1 HNH endonuclease [Methanofollis fontis]
MSATYATKLLLAFRSGDTCAMPGCNCKLTPDSDSGYPINVGEAAHIAGEHNGDGKKKRSARYDPSMTDEQRNHYNNLIYLCSTCHTTIDAIPHGENAYPVERLHKIKAKHEEKVRQAMLDAFADVGFPELEEATRWATTIQPSVVTTDYSLLGLDDKIKKNDLDDDARGVIAMGLGVASEVSRYIESVAQTDAEFPERLKAGFLEEYWCLKKEGIKGGDLFELMCRFAQRGFTRQAQRSAGLAVLIHLFETCEVFEK